MAVPDTLEILCMCALQRKTNKEEAYAKVIITYVIFMIWKAKCFFPQMWNKNGWYIS
jgi:hypothetical protein